VQTAVLPLALFSCITFAQTLPMAAKSSVYAQDVLLIATTALMLHIAPTAAMDSV